MSIVKIKKLASDLKEGVEIARNTIESGSALEKLKQFVDTSKGNIN